MWWKWKRQRTLRELQPSPPVNAYVNALLIQLANTGTGFAAFSARNPLPEISEEPFAVPPFSEFVRRLREMARLSPHAETSGGSIEMLLRLHDQQMHKVVVHVNCEGERVYVRIERMD